MFYHIFPERANKYLKGLAEAQKRCLDLEGRVSEAFLEEGTFKLRQKDE